MIKFFRKIRQQSLSENRFTKYLIYAIGEIILVVIGILIALQINNNNDLRKEKNLKKVYTLSLIANLKQDSIFLSQFLNVTEKEFKKFVNHYQRVSNSNSSADSLIYIARYEFKQTTSVFSYSFNNQTFKTLVASGDIGLFDKEISNELMQLSSAQEKFNLSINTHNNNYIRQLAKYGEMYPMLMEIPKTESPAQKLMWSNINKKEFSSLFTSVIAFKVVLEAFGRGNSSEILKKTTLLLNKLREQDIKNHD